MADRLFEGEEAVLHVIERIVAPLGLRVDATSPWVDARLPDGSRVQTRFLHALFLCRSGSVHDPVEVPTVRDTLQLVLAGILEDDPRAGREVSHRLRTEHLRRSRESPDPRPDHDR